MNGQKRSVRKRPLAYLGIGRRRGRRVVRGSCHRNCAGRASGELVDQAEDELARVRPPLEVPHAQRVRHLLPQIHLFIRSVVVISTSMF